jgi:uncharacterized protein (TIGR02145 family)
LSADDWEGTSLGAQTVYGEGDSPVQDGNSSEHENLIVYGRLYNWHAINGPGLCPSGFHVPSDEDWMTLEIALGMTENEAGTLGYRGTDEGAKLKSDSVVFSNWNGSNLSGFAALPSGLRSSDGNFLWQGSITWYWTSSPYLPNSAWMRYLTPGDNVFRGNHYSLNHGGSVRCLKDTMY